MSLIRSWTSKHPGRISSNADVGDDGVVEDPDVGAVLGPDHVGREVAVPGGEAALEHAGGFDQVIIDADEDHVRWIHLAPPVPDGCTH
jgi:hypothetical protein